MRVREIRRAKRLTQKRLAELTGLARESIARIESGRVTPELPTLIRIADVLGCSLDELAGRDAVKESIAS